MKVELDENEFSLLIEETETGYLTKINESFAQVDTVEEEEFDSPRFSQTLCERMMQQPGSAYHETVKGSREDFLNIDPSEFVKETVITDYIENINKEMGRTKSKG